MIAGIGSSSRGVKSTSRLLLSIFVLLMGSCFNRVLITVNLRSPGNAFVEGDASSASYFVAGAAVTGGTITVEGCGTSSLQVFTCTIVYCIL